MARAKNHTEMVYMTFRIPKALADELRASCQDPFTDRVKYGETSAIVSRLLRDHLYKVPPKEPNK